MARQLEFDMQQATAPKPSQEDREREMELIAYAMASAGLDWIQDWRLLALKRIRREKERKR